MAYPQHMAMAVLPYLAWLTSAAATPGINPAWPAGFAQRGTVAAFPSGDYKLLGVGFCRGGPPLVTTATAMVSYVRLSGPTAPNASECFRICSGLARCTGVELRNSDDWCELQIPMLTRTGDGSDQTATDWWTGSDAAAETLLTGNFDNFNSVAASPAALTTCKPRSGFYCWGKVNSCSGASTTVEACQAASRYPCQESYLSEACGPCEPLHVAQDGSDARSPGPASSVCQPDPQAVLPTLRVSLASPWYGGRGHDETLYLAMIYGAKKAWDDAAGEDLIPIPVGRRMPFPINITGHTESWNFTLSAEQLAKYGMDSSWDTRIENHPMSGVRAMATLMQDAYVDQYKLMEPADALRSKPHCIIGSTPENSLSGVLPHSNADLPVSHVATFYETPVLGWAFQSKEFADKTNHKYYTRVNRVGLDYHMALVTLLEHFAYTRIGVVTPGTNRRLVRGLQENLGKSYTLEVEDMSLQNECSDGTFEVKCHSKLIESMERLRQKDMRIIVHEQGGLTQLDNYWPVFANLLRNDTLLIQAGVLSDCMTPMLPPTRGEHGLDVFWENIRKASNMNNRGEWDLMHDNLRNHSGWGQHVACRVCPNWAFRDLPVQELANRTRVAEHNSLRIETIYGWASFCPELPTMQDILDCTWCDPLDDFWITPTCGDELAAMRQQLTGSMCVGVARKDDDPMIERWASYLSNLTADELVAAGAPRDFFDIFQAGHPLFAETGVTMADRWAAQGPWRRALREKASLLDAVLLSLVAFNSWVRAAGDSTPALSATALRSGFRTTHNTAIANWQAYVQGSTFDGLTGRVQFNPQGERHVDYTLYSAGGANLSYSPVGTFALGGALVFSAAPTFNSGASAHPPDREPACPPGAQYLTEERGCSACPKGMYCPGDPVPSTRVPAIACAAGSVSPEKGASSCQPCPAGTSPDAAQKRCFACAEGFHAPEEGSAACIPCGAGTAWARRPAANASLFLLAPSERDVSLCVECARGKYQDLLSQTECKTCGAGQETFAAGALSRDACLCPPQFYLPIAAPGAQASCVECPKGMECKIGSDAANFPGGGGATGGTGEFPRLLPRFWSSTDEPTSVYLCLNEKVCPGGEPGKCAQGATSLACATCPRGTYWASGECVACNDFETSLWLFPLMPCLFGCPIVCLLYWAARTPAENWSRPKAGFAPCAVAILVHFQIQGMLWKLNLYLPPLMASSWGAFSELVAGLSMLRPRCAGVVEFRDTYYLNVSAPIMVAGVFLVTLLVSRLLNFVAAASRRISQEVVSSLEIASVFRSQGSQEINNDADVDAEAGSPLLRRARNLIQHKMDVNCLMSGFGAVMETFSTAIAVLSMSLFHCYSHPNGKTSLHIAPEILCDSPERQELVAVGVVAILVYCVAGLVLATWVLVMAPRRFADPAFRKRWRFLLAKYRPDVHWWSVVMLGRGLALSLAAIAFTDGGQQLLYVIFVLGAYGFWANYFKPWRHFVTNTFDVVMSVALVAGAAAMMNFAANPADSDSKDALNSLIVIFTKITNFTPEFIAVVLGSRLVWQFLKPAVLDAEIRRLASDLERVGKNIAEAESAEEVLECLSLLPEIDRLELASSLNILLSESQLRLLNLRKSMERSSVRSSAKLRNSVESATAGDGAGVELALPLGPPVQV